MLLNEFNLKHFNKLNIVEYNIDVNNSIDVATVMANIAGYGYVFSKTLFARLMSSPKENIVAVHNILLKVLNEKHPEVKQAYDLRPMYPNFPEQVIAASDAELLLNAFVHYIGDALGLRIMPAYTEYARRDDNTEIEFKVIGLNNKDEFMESIGNLLSSPTSLPETLVTDLSTILIEDNMDFKDLLNDVKNRETAAHLMFQYIKLVAEDKSKKNINFEQILKSPIDVLRVALLFSERSASDTQFRGRFKSVPRKIRRLLLAMLNSLTVTDNEVMDISLYRKQFVNLGEMLHPSEYGERFQQANDIFDFVRNHENRSYFALVEHCLNEKTFESSELLEKLLTMRPGYFVRSLVALSKHTEQQKLAGLLQKVVNKVSTPVLLQCLGHLEYNDFEFETRMFTLKKGYGNFMVLDNPDAKYKDYSIFSLVIENELKTRTFGEDFVLAEEVKELKIPFGIRSASDNVRLLGRGSVVKSQAMEANEVLRLFCFWEESNTSGRVDLDLSVGFYDEGFSKRNSFVSYSRPRASNSMAVHSGDITSAPMGKGACEYIDINMSAWEDLGRYAVMELYSFNGVAFDEYTAQCGFMFRKQYGLNAGQIFDPKTVSDKFSLVGEGRNRIVAVFDLKERHFIWVDLCSEAPQGIRNIQAHNPIKMLKHIVFNSGVLDLEHLFELRNDPNGKLVTVGNDDTYDVNVHQLEQLIPYYS